MEYVVVVDVADASNGFSNHLVVVKVGLGGDFTTDHDHIAFDKGFASHSARFVLCEAGIQNGVGNGIANLVRMAFTDGFRRENVIFAHKWVCMDSSCQLTY